MKEIITLLIVAAVLMLSFPLMLILGIARKSLKLVIASVAAFFLSSALGVWAGARFVTKSYRSITTLFRPRSGPEIYTALFGEGGKDCVKVIGYQDELLPKIGYAIWLHAKLCPAELRRITLQHGFTSSVVTRNGLNVDGPGGNEHWFDPETLGDSILVFSHMRDDGRNGQTIYAATDSTEAYVIDMIY